MGSDKIQKMTAVKFAALRYGPLLPIGPPMGNIAPNSGLKPEKMGKIPAMWTPHGWSSYPWTKMIFSPSQIDAWGAGIGLLLGELVAIDIDVRDESMSQLLRGIVVRRLGKCVAMRVGEAPKCAFICRLRGAPLLRRQLHFNFDDKHHCVELLAEGQQIVLWGMHPRTMQNYDWPFGVPPAAELPEVDYALIEVMFAEIKESLDHLGIANSPTGGGQITRRDEVDQESLIGPLERVREAVAYCPNTHANYPSRQDAIRMAVMIKAATIHDPGEGFEIWLKWALDYPGNNEEFAIDVWETLPPPYCIGMEQLWRETRRFGHSDAKYDFDPVVPETAMVIPMSSPECTVKNSEIWLSLRLLE